MLVMEGAYLHSDAERSRSALNSEMGLSTGQIELMSRPTVRNLRCHPRRLSPALLSLVIGTGLENLSFF